MAGALPWHGRTRTCVAAGTRCPTLTAAPWSPRWQLSSLCKHFNIHKLRTQGSQIGAAAAFPLSDASGANFLTATATSWRPRAVDCSEANNYFCFYVSLSFTQDNLPGLALVARPTVATAVYRVVASRFASHSVLECFNTRIVIEDSSRVMRNGSQQATRGQCALAADA